MRGAIALVAVNLGSILLMSGCVIVTEGDDAPADPEQVFLDSVGSTVTGPWTDAKLLEGAHLVCAELDRTGGDLDAMIDDVIAAQQGDFLAEANVQYRNDMSAVISGAVTWVCPRWSDLAQSLG